MLDALPSTGYHLQWPSVLSTDTAATWLDAPRQEHSEKHNAAVTS